MNFLFFSTNLLSFSTSLALVCIYPMDLIHTLLISQTYKRSGLLSVVRKLQNEEKSIFQRYYKGFFGTLIVTQSCRTMCPIFRIILSPFSSPRFQETISFSP